MHTEHPDGTAADPRRADTGAAGAPAGATLAADPSGRLRRRSADATRDGSARLPAFRHGGALPLMVLAVVVLWPWPAAAQWDKSIDWAIPCTALLADSLGTDNPVCDDVHRPDSGIKATLDEASLWLQNLDFASPAISDHLDLTRHMDGAEAWRLERQIASERDPRCETRYCAWLVFQLGSHGVYSPADSSLVLDPFRITEQGLVPGYDDGFGFTEVHELFHAVQAGYRGYLEADVDGSLDWISEGSADHVAQAAGERKGMSVAGSLVLRTYDLGLHVPPTADESSAEYQAWSYGSWEFFDFLGDHLGSADGVAYLDVLLEALDAGQNNGLEAVEAAVRQASGEGLYAAYPEFVARRLNEPCYYSHLGEWDGFGCTDGPDSEHRFALSFPDTVKRLTHTARGLGVNAYLVRAEIPEGEQGQLTVRVPQEEDQPYLHLVVDDRRFDGAGENGRRNEYTTLLPAGRHELLVRLANVPRSVSEVPAPEGMNFPEEDPAPVEFVLVESEHRYFGRLTGEIGSAATGRDCGPGGESLSYGPLDWLRREGELTAAMNADVDLVAHVVRGAMGIPIPEEQMKEIVVSASRAPLEGRGDVRCRQRRPHFGRMEIHRRDISGMSDTWSGSPVSHAVDFGHAASADRRSLSGILSASARARILEEDDASRTFAVHFGGTTEGTCGVDRSATRRGVLGCGGEAVGVHIWGWIVETAAPVTVRATLRADARDRAVATAAFLPTVVLDGRVPMGVPTSPAGAGGALAVVASEDLQTRREGMGERLRQQLQEMSPEERARLEAYMGGELEEAMASAAEAMGEGLRGTADGVVSLPGPPPDRETVTYYLMTLAFFELDDSTRDASGESGRGAGGFRARAAASVVSRLERLTGSGQGAPPQLPGLEDVEARLGIER